MLHASLAYDSKHSAFYFVIYLFSSSRDNAGPYTGPASLYPQVIAHPNCSVSAPTVLMVIDMGENPFLSLSTGSCYHVQDALKCFGEDLMSLFGLLTVSCKTGLCHGSSPPLLVPHPEGLQVWSGSTHTPFSWLCPHRRPCSLLMF